MKHPPKNVAHTLSRPLALALIGLYQLSVCQITSADTIFGVYAGIGQWQTSYSGNFSSIGSSIDIESDLAFDDENQNFFYAAVEHPIPLIPNFKIKSTDLDSTVNTSLSRTITFQGNAFTVGSIPVEATLDLSHRDFTLYYELLDNWVSLDLGFTARHFDGTATLTQSGTTAEQDLDEWVPTAYGAASFELPFSGFYAAAEINAIGFNSSNITDYTLKLGYESTLRVGAELGYRSINFSLEDIDEFESDLDIDGLYFALTLHI